MKSGGKIFACFYVPFGCMFILAILGDCITDVLGKAHRKSKTQLESNKTVGEQSKYIPTVKFNSTHCYAEIRVHVGTPDNCYDCNYRFWDTSNEACWRQ
jgi:hypothetical protein